MSEHYHVFEMPTNYILWPDQSRMSTQQLHSTPRHNTVNNAECNHLFLPLHHCCSKIANDVSMFSNFPITTYVLTFKSSMNESCVLQNTRAEAEALIHIV